MEDEIDIIEKTKTWVLLEKLEEKQKKKKNKLLVLNGCTK